MTGWHPLPISTSLLPETIISLPCWSQNKVCLFLSCFSQAFCLNEENANTVCGQRGKLEKVADCAVDFFFFLGINLAHSQISILLNDLIF